MEKGLYEIALGSIESRSSGLAEGIGMILVIRGTVTLERDGVESVLTEDNLALVNRGEVFSIQNGSPNLLLVLKISPDFIERECPELFQYRYVCDSSLAGVSSMDNIKYFNVKRALIHMVVAYYKHREGYLLEVKHTLLGLLKSLYNDFRVPLRANVTRWEGADRQVGNALKKALRYIQKNFRSRVTAQAIARSAQMSPRALSGVFREKMGMGYAEYVNKVRLAHAMVDLAQPDLAMPDVARRNGFASPKAFSAMFKSRYGLAPSVYRRRRLADDLPFAAEPPQFKAFMTISQEGGLEDLAKYSLVYDFWAERPPAQSNRATFSLRAGNIERRGNTPERIFKLGRMCEGMHFAMREQIEIAQKELGGDRIYFQGVFGDGLSFGLKNSPFWGIEYARTLAFFHKMGLAPFVRLDLSLAPVGRDGRIAPIETLAAVRTFMDVCLQNLPADYGRSCRFEILHTAPMERRHFMDCYAALYRMLKEISPSIGVGFQAISSSNPGELDDCAEQLLACKIAGCEPDFLTLSIDPRRERHSAAFSDAECEALRTYGKAMIANAWYAIRDCGVRTKDIYVTEWNTLAYEGQADGDVFFRSAIIVHELLDYAGEASGIAYWLNSWSKETMTGIHDDDVISLFLCDTVRNLPFYILQLLNFFRYTSRHRFGNFAISKGDGADGEIVVIALNPRYFNPYLVDEETHLRMERVRAEIELQDIPPGRYIVKCFSFEKKTAGKYFQIAHGNKQYFFDPDILAQLEQDVRPALSTHEADLEGSCTLRAELGYNAIVVYVLKKEERPLSDGDGKQPGVRRNVA